VCQKKVSTRGIWGKGKGEAEKKQRPCSLAWMGREKLKEKRRGWEKKGFLSLKQGAKEGEYRGKKKQNDSIEEKTLRKKGRKPGLAFMGENRKKKGQRTK